ncbi:MAG: hypothetical protein D6832_07685 [Alphaproteobacteria bacterium]|nr:MAG: hypothetical protein D6832_07685 [Alphaproteobacteria bacterium]
MTIRRLVVGVAAAALAFAPLAASAKPLAATVKSTQTGAEEAGVVGSLPPVPPEMAAIFGEDATLAAVGAAGIEGTVVATLVIGGIVYVIVVPESSTTTTTTETRP